MEYKRPGPYCPRMEVLPGHITHLHQLWQDPPRGGQLLRAEDQCRRRQQRTAGDYARVREPGEWTGTRNALVMLNEGH
jgi:hypothetical protein